MRRTAQLVIGIALMAGCSGDPTTASTVAGARSRTAASTQASGAAELKDLATLRRVTARFHDFDAAVAAGWSAKITSCMTDPALGGMGFHYGNTALIDGTARVDQPELLL